MIDFATSLRLVVLYIRMSNLILSQAGIPSDSVVGQFIVRKFTASFYSIIFKEPWPYGGL